MVRKENFLQVDNFGVCFNVKKKFCFPLELQLKNGNNAERLGRILSFENGKKNCVKMIIW